jgi:septum formation protein
MPSKRKRIILASSSVQRRKIFRSAKINFRVVPSGVKESLSSKYKISFLVKYNAFLKAEEVSKKLKQGLVLGLDTLVLFKKEIIGKIFSFKEAKDLLRKINGKRLEVYTGICLMDAKTQRYIADYDKTIVYVRKFPLEKINRYLRYLGPFDKAGGFSIEGAGAILFDEIRGSYFNVLGLPLRKLAILLERIGEDIFDYIKR